MTKVPMKGLDEESPMWLQGTLGHYGTRISNLGMQTQGRQKAT